MEALSVLKASALRLFQIRLLTALDLHQRIDLLLAI